MVQFLHEFEFKNCPGIQAEHGLHLLLLHQYPGVEHESAGLIAKTIQVMINTLEIQFIKNIHAFLILQKISSKVAVFKKFNGYINSSLFDEKRDNEEQIQSSRTYELNQKLRFLRFKFWLIVRKIKF